MPQTVLIPRASLPKVADKYLPIVFPFEISAAGPRAAAPLSTHTCTYSTRVMPRWKFASGRASNYMRLYVCAVSFRALHSRSAQRLLSFAAWIHRSAYVQCTYGQGHTTPSNGSCNVLQHTSTLWLTASRWVVVQVCACERCKTRRIVSGNFIKRVAELQTCSCRRYYLLWW